MPADTKKHLEQFIQYLEKNNKEGAINFALSLLENETLTVPVLYEDVLAPSLNRIEVPREKEDSLIWREHLMSYIVRTVMEAAYPYVLKERDKAGKAMKGKLVVLACPEEEYHEIGIRMGADFFTILGYQVAFIGSNTPRDTLLNAVQELKPAIVSISITNFLNLAQLPAIVLALKALKPDLQVYLSGSALKHTGKDAADFNADGVLNTFASIQALGEGKK